MFMRAKFCAIASLIVTASLLDAQAQPAQLTEGSGWRRGVLTDLTGAFEAATKQRGLVVVCFSSDPVTDNSAVAQVFGANEIRDWTKQEKVVPVLVEFAKARTPGVQEARARFVELTRQYQVAGSLTWLFLDASGKETGRFGPEDFLTADTRGDMADQCDPRVWLKQATSILKNGRPTALPDPVKEPTWYARFGGQGWTGKRTIIGEEGAMNYTLHVPKSIVKGRKYPLIVWLHGGVRSDGNEISDADAVHLGAVASAPGKTAFLLVPSAIAGQSWKSAPAGAGSPLPSPSMMLIAKLLDTLPQSYDIDVGRVIVMGESGGANGSWALLQYYPDRFAGAVINSGGGEPAKVDRLVKQRIWIIHGEKDQIIPVGKDEEMFKAVMQIRSGELRVLTEDDWVKTADTADTIRFWKHTQSGHVPAFDYAAGLDWVMPK
jgi:dienelactone hydrolase